MKRRPMRRLSRRRHGFTLMEVLLVLIILVLLGGAAMLFIVRIQASAFTDAARNQINIFQQALDLYRLQVGFYPSDQQGLNALVQAPGDLSNPAKWKGPYLKTAIPNDPWEMPYKYTQIGPEQVQITSAGPDRLEGTADDITG